MEAAGVINRLFASDPAARRRNLYLRCAVWGPAWGPARGAAQPGTTPACGGSLAGRRAVWGIRAPPPAPCCVPLRQPHPTPPSVRRRFAVLPIGEDNGVVEWVLNTTGAS